MPQLNNVAHPKYPEVIVLAFSKGKRSFSFSHCIWATTPGACRYVGKTFIINDLKKLNKVTLFVKYGGILAFILLEKSGLYYMLSIPIVVHIALLVHVMFIVT